MIGWLFRLPAVLQSRLADKPALSDEHLREAVVEACAMVDEELLAFQGGASATSGNDTHEILKCKAYDMWSVAHRIDWYHPSDKEYEFTGDR